MLTEADSRPDGKSLAYLRQPTNYRDRDSDLFDWLHQVVAIEEDRRTVRIEGSQMLGRCAFHSKILADDLRQRQGYFKECIEKFAGCDLVFFDPDNGLEIKTIRCGQKNSCKFLYWDEARGLFDAGSSVLIYQHFTRESRDKYIARLTHELRTRLRPSAVFSFRTPHVLFLLGAHEKHASYIRKQIAVIQSNWKDIICEG